MAESLFLSFLKLTCLVLLAVIGVGAFTAFFEGYEFQLYMERGSEGCSSSFRPPLGGLKVTVQSPAPHCPFANVGVYLESGFLTVIVVSIFFVVWSIVVPEKTYSLLLTSGALLMLGSVLQSRSVDHTLANIRWTMAQAKKAGMRLDDKKTAGMGGQMTAVLLILTGLNSR